MGREKLFYEIFETNKYNTLNRPADNDDVTVVTIELKILQIDLVSIYL